MKFPNTFTKERKVKFYNSRKKEMLKQLKKSLNKIQILKEIEICENEIIKLIVKDFLDHQQ